MSYEVGRGAVIASWGALGAVVTVAVHRGVRARRVVLRDPGVESGFPADLHNGPSAGPTSVDARFDRDAFGDAPLADAPFDRAPFDDVTRSALAACLFDAAADDHSWWTVMVIDPALHDTPSHVRLVGHYGAELGAMDAADDLAHELNSCLVPGEAPLTATAIGIEPGARPAQIGDGALPAADWIHRHGPVAHTGEAVYYGTSIGDIGRGRR